MKVEALNAIARVRRVMPRNPDVMLICDELEHLLIKVLPDGEKKPKFDRNAYQRDLMRERRLRQKEQKPK